MAAYARGYSSNPQGLSVRPAFQKLAQEIHGKARYPGSALFPAQQNSFCATHFQQHPLDALITQIRTAAVQHEYTAAWYTDTRQLHRCPAAVLYDRHSHRRSEGMSTQHTRVASGINIF